MQMSELNPNLRVNLHVEAPMRQVSDVQVTFDDGMAHVTLNRPDRRNAYDGEVIAELQAAFDSAPECQ